VRRLRTLMRVTLPILLPTFIAGGLWVFAKVFRNLTLPLVLSSTQTKTFSMVLYETWTQRGDVPLASAMGLLMILALGLMAYGARRVILRGFTEG
jgi:iron(III) transport system permease protein